MWKVILKTTALAGTLDILAAFANAYLTNGIKPITVLQYISSGLLGSQAYNSSAAAALGMAIHFLIVFCCTLFYFLLYPKLRLLQQNALASALLIALVARVVTIHVILPLSNIKPPAFDGGKAVLETTILFVCIGLPIAFAAKRYYG